MQYRQKGIRGSLCNRGEPDARLVRGSERYPKQPVCTLRPAPPGLRKRRVFPCMRCCRWVWTTSSGGGSSSRKCCRQCHRRVCRRRECRRRSSSSACTAAGSTSACRRSTSARKRAWAREITPYHRVVWRAQWPRTSGSRAREAPLASPAPTDHWTRSIRPGRRSARLSLACRVSCRRGCRR